MLVYLIINFQGCFKNNSNYKYYFTCVFTQGIIFSHFVKKILAMEIQQISSVIEALTIAQIVLVAPERQIRIKGSTPLRPKEARTIIAIAKIDTAPKQAAKNKGPNPKGPRD